MSAISQLFDGLHGVIFPFAGSTAPGGFLLRYGQAVSRATYASLFGAIGTAHGVGDGSTTFNVPDLRGRTIAGIYNMGGVAASRLTTAAGGVDGATLGAVGGAQTHTLTTAQIPSHAHPVYGQVSSGSGGSNVNAATTGSNYTADNATAAAGGSGAHPNVQPTGVMNWIIKT